MPRAPLQLTQALQESCKNNELRACGWYDIRDNVPHGDASTIASFVAYHLLVSEENRLHSCGEAVLAGIITWVETVEQRPEVAHYRASLVQTMTTARSVADVEYWFRRVWLVQGASIGP